MKRFIALAVASILNFSVHADARESAKVTTLDVQALACHYEEDSLDIFKSYMYSLPGMQEMIQMLKDENRCALLTIPMDASRLERCLNWLENCRGFSMEYKGEKYFVTLFPPF